MGGLVAFFISLWNLAPNCVYGSGYGMRWDLGIVIVVEFFPFLAYTSVLLFAVTFRLLLLKSVCEGFHHHLDFLSSRSYDSR